MSHVMHGPHLHRPTHDIFRGDPFKIQSYKFRYAERPVYTVQHYPRPEPQPQPQPEPLCCRSPQFETFYRNPKFSSDPEYRVPATPSGRYNPQNTTDFAEHRRRKLLREFQSVTTAPSRRTFSGVSQPEGVQRPSSVSMVPQPRRHIDVTNSPLLKPCCNRGDYQTMGRGQSATTLVESCSTNVLRPGSPRSASMATFDSREREWKQSVVDRSSSNIQLLPKRSACSGCEININIGTLDSESEADNNLIIKIETDTCMLNNTDRAKQTERHQRSSSASRSTLTFDIDKRLSKFCVADNKSRRSPEQDASQRERELERKMERERARQRERNRENLRQQERQMEYERLLELEVEREKDRLRELERESQRRKEYHEYQQYQEHLRREQQKRQEVAMRAMPISPPVMMTSHLYRRTSNDRLPGMVQFCDRPPAAATKRAQRLQSCSKNLTSLRGLKKTTAPVATAPPPAPTFTTAPSTVRPPRSLERTSSGTSNGNVHVTLTTNDSSSNLRRPSATVMSEQKQLNDSAGVKSPILTRLNNIPIRITTSRPSDRDLEFSMNQVRLRNQSPMPGVAPRLSTSRMRLGDECSSVHSLNVNINVYTDTTSRRMRM